MMAENTNEKNQKKSIIIKNVFNTMEYGSNLIDLSETQKWLNDGIYLKNSLDSQLGPEIDLISDLPIKLEDFFRTKAQGKGLCYSEKRSKILRKIADHVQKKADFFAEIMALTKRIPIKTTKKVDVPIIVDYLRFYSTLCEDPDTPWDCSTLIVIPAENVLCTLVLGFAQYFSTNSNITFLVEGAMSPSAFAFVDICYNAGVPVESLKLVTLTNITLETLIPQLTMVYTLYNNLIYLGDISLRRLIKCNATIFTRSRCSMIVHDDADLRSACEAVLENAWSHNGELPWQLKYVYVQESVYEAFIQLIKQRMNKIIIGLPEDKMTDIALIQKNGITKLPGGKCFYPNLVNYNKYFVPTILYDTEFSADYDKEWPILTILPYRNLIEAAKLVNNSMYGLAASIWSESYTVVSELEQLLDVSLMWINDYGVIKPEIAITPRKESGFGCFGGVRGLIWSFWSYRWNDSDLIEGPIGSIDKLENSSGISSQVEKSKKALQEWRNFSIYKRKEYLEALGEKLGKDWTSDINTILNKIKMLPYQRGVTETVEPVGVLGITSYESEIPRPVLITALLTGNSVIMHSVKFQSICKHMLECGFPANTLICLENVDNSFEVLISHEEVHTNFFFEREQYRRAKDRSYSRNYLLRMDIDYQILTLLTTYTKTSISTPGNSLAS